MQGRLLNHFAFEIGSLDEVFRARSWLRERSVPIHFEGRRRAGCQIAIEFQDPDGNNLEIYWNIDQVGTEGSGAPRQRVASGEDAGGGGGQPGQRSDPAAAQLRSARPLTPCPLP